MEISGGNGDDVIYGGDGNDFVLEMWDRGHDKLYCGKGKDEYEAEKKDFVSSSCEKKAKLGTPIP
jgi:RTX calcium-binding nonapeptide repeat (4 copies)